MFDKYRARFAKFEEDHESVRKVTKHIEKHQLIYGCGATGIICILGTRTFARPSVINNIVEQAPAVIAPVFNNAVAPVMNNVVDNTVNNAGHCCKIIQGLDDADKLWPKAALLAAELAEEHGITFDAARTMLSKHLNGHSEHVFGKRYMTYGLGTTG